jgi:hypothetical protein
MSMKNSNDTIGNRTHDLQVCSAVTQTLRHRVPRIILVRRDILKGLWGRSEDNIEIDLTEGG